MERAPDSRPVPRIESRPVRVSIDVAMWNVAVTVVVMKIREGRESDAIRSAAGDTVEVD